MRRGPGRKVVVLRVHRARNPDLVCIERLERFLHDMHQGGSPVILSGVRDDLARAMRNMRFERWFPGERLFAADPGLPGSSTIKAVRYAFELAEERLQARCEHCDGVRPGQGALYYMV